MTGSEPESPAASGPDPAAGAPPSVAREFRAFWMRLFQYGALFVSTLLVARALGPSQRAEYALPFALSGAVWVLLNFTVEGAAGRLVGRREASFEAAARVLSLCTAIMSACGIVITLVIGWLGSTAFLARAPESIVAVAALSIPGLLTTQTSGYLLLMRGRIRTYAVAALVAALVQLAMVVIVIAAGRFDATWAAVSTTAGFIMSGALMTGALAYREGSGVLSPRVERRVLTAVLRVGIRIHPMSVAIQLGPRLELLVVGALASVHQTGLYSLALTVAQMPLFAAWTLAQSGIGPITDKPESEAVEYGCEFTRQTALVGLALALAGSAVVYPFITLAYGSAWEGAAVPLIILLIGTTAMAVENPLRTLLLRVAPPIHMAAVAAASLVLNTLLTVALMAPMGIVGAALASFIAYWALTGGMVWLLVRAVDHVPLRRSLRRPGADDWIVATAARSARRAAAPVLARIGRGSRGAAQVR